MHNNKNPDIRMPKLTKSTEFSTSPSEFASGPGTSAAFRQRVASLAMSKHTENAGLREPERLLPGQKRSWSGADCRFELAAACRLAPSAGRRGRACPAACCSEATVACSPTVHIQEFCTLELKPTTLNPKLCTLNPKTQTLPGAGP